MASKDEMKAAKGVDSVTDNVQEREDSNLQSGLMSLQSKSLNNDG